jgi:hypothetical protein
MVEVTVVVDICAAVTQRYFTNKTVVSESFFVKNAEVGIGSFEVFLLVEAYHPVKLIFRPS